MQNLLFLCTGNYYRSRFAEILFNHLAPQTGLAWQAASRGLEPHPGNPGPISQHTLQALEELGIPIVEPRLPLRATLSDFQAADLVIAVKEAEHRSLMQMNFPEWTDCVEYWHVHDLDCAAPEETIRHLKQELVNLIDRLTKES